MGGAMHNRLHIIQFKASSNLSSPSSSKLNLPVSANNSAPATPSFTRLESVGGREGKRTSGSLYNLIFGSVPTPFEVESAIAAFQNFMNGISSSGIELKWLQPMLDYFDSRILSSQGFGRVYDAIRLLQTEPSIKRLVISISSDKAVWDAIMNNELVQKLRESLCAAEDSRLQGSMEEPDLGTLILRGILETAKLKIMELIEKFQALLSEMFRPPDHKEKHRATETRDSLDEKVRSSFLLSVLILLIVVVARAHRG